MGGKGGREREKREGGREREERREEVIVEDRGWLKKGSRGEKG